MERPRAIVKRLCHGGVQPRQAVGPGREKIKSAEVAGRDPRRSESVGVKFIEENGGGPGVRLRKRRLKKG